MQRFVLRKMIRDGADIIGCGESTRPGHVVITEEEEIARVTRFIKQLKEILIFRYLLIHIRKITLAALRRRFG